MVSGNANGGDVAALLKQHLGSGVGMVYRLGVAAKAVLKLSAAFSVIVDASRLPAEVPCLKGIGKLFRQPGGTLQMFF